MAPTQEDEVALETERLLLRRFRAEDLDDLARLYADAEVRRHFPRGVLTKRETQAEIEKWIVGDPADPRLTLWATIDKASGRLIGRCGYLRWVLERTPKSGNRFSDQIARQNKLLPRQSDSIRSDNALDGRPEIEIAYLLDKAYWGRGLGAEIAQALVRHGFAQLGLSRLIALIAPGNIASIRAAEAAGLRAEREMEFHGTAVVLYARDAGQDDAEQD